MPDVFTWVLPALMASCFTAMTTYYFSIRRGYRIGYRDGAEDALDKARASDKP